MELYILTYNNYYNRQVKLLNSIAEYAPYVIYTLVETNFNPNDGVDTEHLFGTAVNNYSGKGDYMIAVDSDGEIVSRWFIIETQRTRGGQWKLSLHRDVVADYYQEVVNDSTYFIYKGFVPSTSPLVYNKEAMETNQIKTSEIPIENNLKTPWVVAYLSRFNGEGAYNIFKGTFRDSPELSVDYELDSIEQYPYYSINAENPYNYVLDN